MEYKLKFNESLYDFRQRQLNGKTRKPCRTYLELSEYLCKKYNVTDAYLRGCLRRPDAPKMVVRHRSTVGVQNSWYDPSEFVAWFKKVINEERRDYS
jgi:hypothetical protein